MSHFTPELTDLVNDPRMPVIQGQVLGAEPGPSTHYTIGMLRPLFLDWVRYETRRSVSTVKRYEEALGWVIRDIGDIAVGTLHSGHVMELRRKMDERGCGEARMAAKSTGRCASTRPNW